MNGELPSFLTREDDTHYTLTLSASAAECFMLCPAKYSWSRITGIEAAVVRAGQNYGKAMHLLLAALYSGKPFDAEAIVREHFAAHPQPEMGRRNRPEWRTATRALQAFAAYRAFYPADDFEVVGVEEPFEVTLGEFRIGGECDDFVVTVRLRGIRDLRVRWHDQLWVLDHKTSTEWSDLVVDEGKASFQFMSYAWVERFLRNEQADANTKLACSSLEPVLPPLNVGGVIGSYLVAREPYAEGRKPTARDLPRDQFERVPYPYSDAQLDEWHERAMGLAQAIWRCFTSESWPQHSTACAHWGRCEYYRLCWETDPAYRLAAALSADYQPRTPSPFEDEANGKERE